MSAGPAGATGRQAAATEVAIGPLTVRTDAADVDAFAHALGPHANYGPVPLTFPIRWLSLPAVRGEISRALGLDQTPLVQQSQTFDYARRLECDHDYAFALTARRAAPSPDRTVLHATIRDAAGNDMLTMDTVLRTLQTVRPAPARETAAGRPPAAADDSISLRLDPFDLAQTQRYAAASLDHNPLHSDLDAARAVGLDGLIVHGMLVMGQFEPALAAWRPGLRVDRLHGTFLRPLPVGGRVIVSGRVVKTAADEGGERLVLRLVARSLAGDAVCVGEVTARPDAARAGRAAG